MEEKEEKPKKIKTIVAGVIQKKDGKLFFISKRAEDEFPTLEIKVVKQGTLKKY